MERSRVSTERIDNVEPPVPFDYEIDPRPSMKPEESAKAARKRASRSSTSSGSSRRSQSVSITPLTPDGQQNDAAAQVGPATTEDAPSGAHGAAGRADHPADRKASRSEPGKPDVINRRKSTSSGRSAPSGRSSRTSSRSAPLANDGVGAAGKTAASMPEQRCEEQTSRKQSRAAVLESTKDTVKRASLPPAVSGGRRSSLDPASSTTGLETRRSNELSAVKDTGMSGSSTSGTTANPTPSSSAAPAGSRDDPTEAFKVSKRKVSSSEVPKANRDRHQGMGTLQPERLQPEIEPYVKKHHSEGLHSKSLVVAVFLLVIVVLPLLAFTCTFLFVSKGAPGAFPICSTEGCRGHAMALSARRNRSLDPCDDFGLYVCAAWQLKFSGLATTMVEQTILDSILEHVRPNMSNYDTDLPFRRRPEQLMALCDTARPTGDGPAIRKFKEFLRGELGFLVPPGDGRPQPTNWLVSLWFRIDLMTRSGELHIGLSAEPLARLWNRVHNSFNKALYQRYVEEFIEVIYDSGSVSGGASKSYLQFLRSRSAYVQASALLATTHVGPESKGAADQPAWSIQTNVFKELSTPSHDRYPLPFHGRISDLQDFVPMFTAKDWTSALAAAFDTMVHDSTAVYVSSRTVLDSMRALLGSFSSLELLYHTAWWFLQQIATFTSNRLYTAATTALGSHGKLYLKVLCAAQPPGCAEHNEIGTRRGNMDRDSSQVSLTYNALMADNFWENRSGADREVVKDTILAVQDTVLSATRVSPSVSKLPVSSSLLDMLHRVRPVVWPEAPLDFQSGQLLLYGDTVDNKHGFFGHWLSCHRTIQGSYGRSWHKAAGLVYTLDTTALSTYKPLQGVISLSTAAAEPPFFYSMGTPAMVFGGLGFAYALRLLLAMDITVLLSTAALGGLVVASGDDRLAQVMTCSDQNETDDAFPYLPALEATHAAYVQSVSGTEEPRLKGMEGFTGAQVFFMTMCFSLCQDDGAGRRSSPPCNAAVRNFAPFATAFRCSDKSPMNPAKKCRFLGSD
ncbi:hypothetical protein HPB50_025570 [Hyalomma asiaticum]|uniref:Uncharacterized protein n=1 Tax=Hyalomma asiaticum TaxID=266040 RepID=A0ACB7ST65_HYAAI|nr:hypothetical protein HPB50_025570 [Hyalomma asiaticum]